MRERRGWFGRGVGVQRQPVRRLFMIVTEMTRLGKEKVSFCASRMAGVFEVSWGRKCISVQEQIAGIHAHKDGLQLEDL